MSTPQTLIKEYIRIEDTKQPRGVVVAIRVGDEIFYGYSLLNTKMDRFSKTLGLQIATNRALSDSYGLPNTPEREEIVLEAFKRIEARALKYFKDIDPENVKLVTADGGSKFTAV